MDMDETNTLELSMQDLNEEEKAKFNDIYNNFNIEDNKSIIEFGTEAQRDIALFSDTILDSIRAKDSGYVGDILSDLMLKLDDLKVKNISSSGGYFEKIPFLKNFATSIKKFMNRYERLSSELDKIIQQLDESRVQLLKDVTMLDNLYEKNLDYMKALNVYIMAGQKKVEELKEHELPVLMQKAAESPDPALSQKAKDLSQQINRFEKKLHDLKLSRMISLQTAPQIRLIQSNDQVLVEKIQTSILNTIPLWKNQVVIAISLFRQKNAYQMQRSVTETTNDLLKTNAELLKENSREVALESERGIVELETLKSVHENLMSTISETLNIQREGRAKRQHVENQLLKLENDLKKRLLDVE